MSDEYIIRKKVIPHCAQGPSSCDKCAEAAKNPKLALLQIYFEHGNMARPTIEVVRDGETKYVEYDVVKYFDNEAEAKEYAKQNNIDDISL